MIIQSRQYVEKHLISFKLINLFNIFRGTKLRLKYRPFTKQAPIFIKGI